MVTLLAYYVSSDMEIKLTFEQTFPDMKYMHITHYYSPVSVKIQHVVLYLSHTEREVNSYSYDKTTVTTTSQVRVRNLCNQHPTLVIEFYLTDYFILLCFKLIILSLKKEKKATKDQYVTLLE